MSDTPTSRFPEAPSPASLSLTAYAVVHTHWDREWYHSASRFQARLVALIDAVLDAPADAATPVLLDGQAIVVRDYLAIRPERQADVSRAIASGALEAGPWYVLGDNQIPCGEALVRNLEAGRRWLARWNGAAPTVAYCPDTFGHPGALPLIATQFGCTSAVVWRGFGGRSFPRSDTAWWIGADDSRVLLYHLAPDGYEFGSALPVAEADAEARWQSLESVLRARNGTGVVLLPVGADHHAPSPHTNLALAALRTAARRTGADVNRSGLGRAMGAMREAALAHVASGPSLPSVRGALRDSYGYTWTLQGTFATRAARKRTNALLERRLLHDTEPSAALAWLHAPRAWHAVSPDGAMTLAQLPALVHHAWETLLSTHPHDTLCGCSIDTVDAEMEVRQRQVNDLTQEIRESALSLALGHDRVVARARDIEASPKVVMRNRAAYPRGGVAEVTIDETIAHVRVGPNSASVTVDHEAHDAAPRAVTLGALAVQPLRQSERFIRRESPQHYPDNDRVRRHHLLTWMPPVPAYGLRVVTEQAAHLAVPHPAVLSEPEAGTVVLSNAHLTVRVDHSGVTVQCGDRVVSNALALRTTADAGDSYTPSLRGVPEDLRLVRVRAGHRGPLRSSAVIDWEWRHAHEKVRVQTELILDTDASYLRCDVRGVNARRHHQLQLRWNTDVAGSATAPAVHVCDAAFGTLEPRTFVAEPDDRPYEQPPSTFPLHRWATLSDTQHGATLISDGLAEGVIDGASLAVTLVRAIGDLSRDDLPERPGHAGWPCPIPRAQSQGRFSARVALLLHGRWDDALRESIEQSADAVLLPLRGTTWRDLQDTDRTLAGPALSGQGLRASAVHVTDGGDGLRLRVLNTRSDVVEGAWHLPPGSWESRPCRMDGTPLGEWRVTTADVPFVVASRATISHDVRRAR